MNTQFLFQAIRLFAIPLALASHSVTSARSQTYPPLPDVTGTGSKGFGNYTPGSGGIAAAYAATANSCTCGYGSFSPPCEAMKEGGEDEDISAGGAGGSCTSCKSATVPKHIRSAFPSGFYYPTPRPRFSPWPSGGSPSSKGSLIDNGSLSFNHWGWDIKRTSPDGVGLQRIHKPREMAMTGSFGPMVFSNFDQTLTLSGGATAGADISIESFDPQDLQRRTYLRASLSTLPPGSDPACCRPSSVDRDALKQMTLLSSNMSPVTASSSGAFDGAAYVRAEAWDGSYVLFKLFDIGVSGNRTGRPVQYSSAVGQTNVTYKTFTPAQLAESPSRAVQIDTVTDRYGSTLSFSYLSTQVSGAWVISSVTAPNGTMRTYSYETGAGAKLTSVSYPIGPNSTFSYIADSDSQTICNQIVDRAAKPGDQIKSAYLSNIASGYNGTNYTYTTVPPNGIRMATNGNTEVTYMSFRNNVTSQAHYEGGGRMKFYGGGAPGPGSHDTLNTAYLKDGWSMNTTSTGVTFSGTTEILSSQLPRTNPGYGSWQPGLDTQDSAGLTKKYIFDADNWVTRISYADGTLEAFCYNSGKLITRYRTRDGEVTQNIYDSANRIIEERVGLIDAPTNTVTIDPYTQAPLYNQCATNDVQTADYAVRKWEYIPAGQNGAGMVSATIDERNNRTDYQYNAQHRLWKILEPADITGGIRPTTVYTYTADGRIATITDPESRVTTYGYDDIGRQTATQYGDGTSDRIEYGTTGNGAGMVVKTIDRMNVVTIYTYDLSQRLTSTVRAAFVRNPQGQDIPTGPGIAMSTNFEYVHGSQLVKSSTTDGAVTDFMYDYRGRIKETKTYPRSGVTLVAGTQFNDEQLYSTTDPYGRKTYRAYDATDGRLIRTVHATVPEWTPPAPIGTQTLSQALLAITRDTSPNAKYIISEIVYGASGRITDAYNPSPREPSQPMTNGGES